MVRVFGFFGFALAVMALAGLASPARPVAAQEAVVVCGNEVAAVRTAIEGAEFVNAKDEAGLLAKVASAESKLAEGKSADAVAALNGIRLKVEALLLAGKVGLEGGQAILVATEAAITCLEAPTLAA